MNGFQIFLVVLIFTFFGGCTKPNQKNIDSEERGLDSSYTYLQLQEKEDENSEGKEEGTPDVVIGWFIMPDSLSQITGSIKHYNNKDHLWKKFSSANGEHFYYNERHGYYVMLPEDMGYLQSGEVGIGSHSNEFYNIDTTVVISSYAFFNDVVLLDNPHYEDSIRYRKKEYFKRLGNPQYIKNNLNEITAKGKIDHSNPDNPPADYYISKLIFKKDIDDRECEMNLTIFYEEKHKSREKEFLDIIRKFPEKPF